MSHLQEKSEALQKAAKLLHDNSYYTVVAHSAYYCCYQLMMHIWLYSMGKTELELKQQRNSHKILIISVGEMMKKSNPANFYAFCEKILKLKKLRTDADYSDAPFDANKSVNALSLSHSIIPILKKY